MASASLIEGFGESSSPVKSLNLKKEIFAKLLEIGNEEATSDHGFMNKLEDHFSRLPNSYGLDMSVDRAEEVVMHWRILRDAKDARKGPAFNVRFLKYLRPTVNVVDDFQQSTEISLLSSNTEVEGDMLQNLRDCSIDFESCTKLEDLNLGIKNADVMNDKRENVAGIAIHEVIFSTLDKPKLLSQLSSLLSNIGLNIREAHVFSTTDGYSLDVFVVDGWPEKEVHNLHKELTKAIAQCEGSWSGVSKSPAKKKMMALEQNIGDWEIDKSFLMMGEKISSGSSGDLHHGTYMDVDVAIKVIKSEHLDDAMGIEFAQEVAILREVHHRNIVRFIGVCTKPPHFCIVTEYMPGGSLYDFLHRHKDGLELSQLLKLAIDISKGMEYLHKNNIIHRDLKTANLLMDNNHVVKVSDFGVARFQSRGVMTAETGTYRWMAPEVIDHQPYDQKADVFSFAIVLWELTTSKVPYDTMTPLQAALGVRQGMRPEFPENTSPRLVDLIRRCWDAVPAKRPSFAAITIELEELLRQTQG